MECVLVRVCPVRLALQAGYQALLAATSLELYEIKYVEIFAASPHNKAGNRKGGSTAFVQQKGIGIQSLANSI